MDILISTDKKLINKDFVYDYLSKKSYWAKGRSKNRIFSAIEGSLCFGIYLKDHTQIGFGRIVTDYAVFAWIMDVFISPEYQSKGYGKKLMSEITNHPQVQTVSRWGLNTLDAHELYRKYGFDQIKEPDIYMEKLVPQE